MIKEFVLIITAVVNGQTFVAPATYYDTKAECEARVERIYRHGQYYNFATKTTAVCMQVVPEVEEKK